MQIEAKLEAMGLVLPDEPPAPQNMRLPYARVRIFGDRAFIAGHGPLRPDGSRPRGKVGRDLTVDEGYQAARLTGLAILGSLKRELGDLDRIVAWLRVFGMVNSAPGFTNQPSVINGFSDLVLDLYGPEIGSHGRSAVGMAELPLGIPVEIEAEVAIRD